jgi:hypothetical protein
MLGDVSPQTIRLTAQAVVYPGRNHVVRVTIEKASGRRYVLTDLTAVTRVVLVFLGTNPVIAYDSLTDPVFTLGAGGVLGIDLSDYAMPASTLSSHLILFDAEHPSGQVIVDDTDVELVFDFRNISGTGTTPPPTVEYVAEAPIDGGLYGRQDGGWVSISDVVAGVASVNGQTGVVVLDAADVGADPAGTGASEAAAAVASHTGAADPHPQYQTQTESDARYERGLVAGSNITIDRTNPAAPVISATGGVAGEVNTASNLGAGVGLFAQKTGVDLEFKSLVAGTNVTLTPNATGVTISASGGGGGGAVDSVNGQTGVVVLNAADVGADAAGTAAAAVSAHEVAVDPHPQYLTAAEGSAAYAPLSHVGAGSTAHANVVAGGAAGFMTGADKTKLDGVAAGAQVNVATNIAQGTRTSTTVPVTSSTGTGATLDAATASLAGVMAAADKAKLDGVATGATANSPDATLLARANHTGTQPASTINDFNGVSRAQTEAMLIAGTNVTLTPGSSGETRTLTIAATGGGGGGATLPVVQALSSTRTLALADINTFNVNSTTSAYTATIPLQSSVAWTADAEIHFLRSSTGAITITAAAGVLLNGIDGGSVTMAIQGGAASIKRLASDSWWMGGLTSAAGGGGGSGTVTSVALSAPTGFSVLGSPVTEAGTLALAFDTGYSLPTSAAQADWSTAFGWGNHAAAGYEKQLTAGANITIDRTDPDNPVISASASSGMTNPMTTAGDVIKGGTGGTPERLAIGTAGQVLTVVGGTPAWEDLPGAGTGDVVGPASAANNGVALFDGTTGKLIKDGGVLGTAAFTASGDYATAAQGALADSATQPGDLATVATTGAYSDLSGLPTLGTAAATAETDYATAAQGALAGTALQPAAIGVTVQAYDAATAKLDAVQTWTQAQRFSTGTSAKMVAMGGGSAIDLALGNGFTKTISGDTTLSLSSVPTTGLLTIWLLELTNGGSAAVTWWGGIAWAEGSPPALTASGRDVLGFYTADGGTTTVGFVVGKGV